jgi:enoyl-CoA hydratase/carnithine racemase
MFALAHDDRVMRADRGFFCLPEVDIGLSFTPGMNALIAARLSPRTAHEAMTTGRRYGGIDAARAGLVEEAVEEAEVLPRALARAAAQGRQGSRHAEGGSSSVSTRTLSRRCAGRRGCRARRAPAARGDDSYRRPWRGVRPAAFERRGVESRRRRSFTPISESSEADLD